MSKNVQGVLFIDYVRMIKSKRDVDWSKYLTPDDMSFLEQNILKSRWYPLDSFERMGVGILKEIANGDMELVRLFGKHSIEDLKDAHRHLVCEDNPRKSLMMFQELRKRFFDFDSIEVLEIQNDFAKLKIGYGMSKIAEEAATYQTLGFFEALLKISGASDVQHNFTSKSWEGDPETVLELSWT
ncbi:MAG: hypothetical protein JSU92_08605 [Deltaproteobacteria bacterium]|nr:MAG: hypothetical protein JSU92_08605 [Deltaproteobacteria bacterium]